MTIPSENYRNDYPGDGSNDTFSYTFKITDESDIKVAQRDTNDVETILTLNVDYTVTGVGALNGGTIILTAGNLTTDYHLTIRRDSDLTQLTDIRNQGDFYPEVHEDTFDKLASVSQTQQSEIDRCVKVSETYPVDVELPGPQAGKVISWNAAGDALINVDPGSVALAEPADSSITPAKIQSGLAFLFPETFVLKKAADVASAAALPLINDGNYADVTGTDAITSIDSLGIGTWMLLQFNGILDFTHHATDLFLCNGGNNITTAAGDHALMVEYGVGKWRCAAYIRANGQPVSLTDLALINPNIILGSDANGDIYYRDAGVLKRLAKGSNGQVLRLASDIPAWGTGSPGGVVQTVNVTDSALASNIPGTAIPYDDSIPQNTEGDEYMTLAITPNASANKLKIDVVLFITSSATNNVMAALFQDSTVDALSVAANEVAANSMREISFTHYMTAGTISSTTFKVRAAGEGASNIYVNGNSAGQKFDGVFASSITITEYAA